MSLVFKHVQSADQVAVYIASAVQEKLRTATPVLWLVPGGSAIAVAATASRLLRESGVPLNNLTVTLTDERYGDVGHPDSNWPQLQAAGFDVPDATLLPVLHGGSLSETVAQFATTLETELNKATFRLGLFGIGADGHTAGMLPHSSAVAETGFAHGYDAGNFTRITMTRPAIALLDEVVVYAVGEEKWPILQQLEADVPVEDQPAQALKQVPIVTIFNDYKGDSI